MFFFDRQSTLESYGAIDVLYREKSDDGFSVVSLLLRRPGFAESYADKDKLIDEVIAFVRRGASVNLVLFQGAIALTIPARSLSSGHYGDTVELIVPETGKRFTGTVKSDVEVVVEIP